MDRVIATLRWTTFTLVPPLAGIGVYVSIQELLDGFMYPYHGTLIQKWLYDSWALDAHGTAGVFILFVIAFHLFIVLPAAIIQAARQRAEKVPIRVLAAIAVIVLGAAALSMPRHSFMSGWLIPMLALGLPMSVLLFVARIWIRPSRATPSTH